MGLALGWMAIALAGLAGTPNTERANGPIQYSVRFVEVEGLGWREAAFTRLTPVTRQGTATLWTAPKGVRKEILQSAIRNSDGHVAQVGVAKARNGSPVHFAIRKNQQLVTQVAWNDDDRPETGKLETVRTGPVCTLTGRQLDQGVIVQLVMEDTEVRAVHHLNLTHPGEHSSQATPGTAVKPQVFIGQGKAAGLTAIAYGSSLTPIAPTSTAKSTTPTDCACQKDDVIRAHLQTTSPASPCCTATTTDATCVKADVAHAVAIEVPEIASQEVAGEWLIPKDGILLVSFGPHTVADKDGKAVIRERLAIVEAEAVTDGAVERASRVPGFVPSPRAVAPAVTPAPRVIPAPVVVPNLPTAVPALPSRSIPQGAHPDGTPAELPPLPADELETPHPSDSAEPSPSPQIKKPQQPGKPAADSQMKKTGYHTTSRALAMPTMFFATPNVGLQFLVPLKPLSFQLPFNRRLEIELFGRVVPEPKPMDDHKSDE